MALTDNFKNECERILRAWRDLIVSQWGKPWVELYNYNEANRGKVVDDPFLASFKTSRTLEEIAWMNKRIHEYYFDTSDKGIFYYISYNFQNGADNGAVKSIYNMLLLRVKFMKNLIDGGYDNLIQQWNQLQTDKDSRPNINLTDYKKLQDNQEKHTDYDTIKKERDNWVAIFPSPLTPDLVKVEYDKPKEVHTDYDTIKAERDQLKIDNASKDTIINDLNHTIKDKDKIIDDNKGLDQKLNDLNKQLSDKDAELAKRTDTITSLTTEKDSANQTIKDLKGQLVIQETQGNTKLFFITRKLLSIYVEEIKKRTELFYQELSIDNNKVNEKYGDKNRNYLLLLHNLTTDSKPEQVINAFRIVALIIATERSQSESDELIKLPRIPVALKNNKLKYFQKVKDSWDLLTNEPTEVNNPFYIPIIKDQANYRKQIQEIITLWAK